MNNLERELDTKRREFLLSANYSAISAYWGNAREDTTVGEMQELTNKLDYEN